MMVHPAFDYNLTFQYTLVCPPTVSQKIGERRVCQDFSPGLPPYRGLANIIVPCTQPREGPDSIATAPWGNGMSMAERLPVRAAAVAVAVAAADAVTTHHY